MHDCNVACSFVRVLNLVLHRKGGSTKRVLMGTFVQRGGKEVTGGWRKLRNEELHDLHSSVFLGKWRMKSRFRNPVRSSDSAAFPRI